MKHSRKIRFNYLQQPFSDKPTQKWLLISKIYNSQWACLPQKCIININFFFFLNTPEPAKLLLSLTEGTVYDKSLNPLLWKSSWLNVQIIRVAILFWQELHQTVLFGASPKTAPQPRDVGVHWSKPGVGRAGGKGPHAAQATLDLYPEPDSPTTGQGEDPKNVSLDSPTVICATLHAEVSSLKTGLRLMLRRCRTCQGLGQLGFCSLNHSLAPGHRDWAGIVTDAWLQSALGESSSSLILPVRGGNLTNDN